MLIGRLVLLVLGALVLNLGSPPAVAQEASNNELDARVRAFLEERQGRWRDLNIPTRDGRFLYDMIVEHGYTRALEIGTSTGHSAIWIAWALSKTGGKLITLEIDEGRHREALENFEQAGVSPYIDARLGDAHELVKRLEGPFDFVFSDADKGWYTQYFIDVAPKMVPGGCYTTHNVRTRGRRGRGSSQGYVDYLMSRPDFVTTVETSETSGIAVTCRKSDE
jgi:predicted O-methyltransferase YrrM